jgi:putative membrane protein
MSGLSRTCSESVTGQAYCRSKALDPLHRRLPRPHSCRMTRFLVRLIIHAIALWLTTLIVSGGVAVRPFTEGVVPTILTYLLVALIFGIVNGIVGTLIRVVAFPLYVLTLGLISLIVNGLLLLLVGWISSLIGFGLVVSGFWWGVLAALVLAILSWLIGLILRPLTRHDRR